MAMLLHAGSMAGDGPEQRLQQAVPDADELSKEMDTIATEYNGDRDDECTSYRARHGLKLRQTFSRLAGLEFEAVGSTKEQRLNTVKKDGGVWYARLRSAAELV